MNENKILDLSMLTDEEVKLIKAGFDSMVNGTKQRYFGYVDKKSLPSLCRVFNYTDKLSFAKGCIFTAGVIWIGYIGVKAYERVKSEEEKEN